MSLDYAQLAKVAAAAQAQAWDRLRARRAELAAAEPPPADLAHQLLVLDLLIDASPRVVAWWLKEGEQQLRRAGR